MFFDNQELELPADGILGISRHLSSFYDIIRLKLNENKSIHVNFPNKRKHYNSNQNKRYLDHI